MNLKPQIDLLSGRVVLLTGSDGGKTSLWKPVNIIGSMGGSFSSPEFAEYPLEVYEDDLLIALRGAVVLTNPMQGTTYVSVTMSNVYKEYMFGAAWINGTNYVANPAYSITAMLQGNVLLLQSIQPVHFNAFHAILLKNRKDD